MNNSILINTIQGKPDNRPPFWFMRQAGRVLPSYLEIKKKYSFWQMMKDPDLGAKVTMLPLNDLKVDALILFSDILVIPYAMGMGLDFTDAGPVFDTPLCKVNDPYKLLNPEPEKLNYIYKIVEKVKTDKPNNIPLIGFCGAPLTVLCYMLQGLSRKADFPDATEFFYKNKSTTKKLIDSVTELSIEYINQQINHGIQVFQLFESHAGIIPGWLYEELFMPAIKKIGRAVRDRNIPFIFFPKGFGYGLKKITPEICDYVSIDWQISLEDARKLVDSEVGLQGNLDPRVLFGSKKEIEIELKKLIEFGSNNQNWIFNLGHGFMPGIPYENALFMAEWIKDTDWNR